MVTNRWVHAPALTTVRRRILRAFSRISFLIGCFWVYAFVFAGVAWAQMILTEVNPAPSTGNDWIELKNIGPVAAALDGWTLSDSTSQLTPVPSLTGQLFPGEYFVVEVGNRLNNSGDSVILKRPGGTLIDQLDYTFSQTNMSWARIPDAGGDWQLLPSTRGTTNVVPSPTPTPTPDPTPTPVPTATPTPSPVLTPSSTPIPTPTAVPTPSPSPSPSPVPSPSVSPSPTPSATPHPTPTPTLSPSPSPTIAPSPTSIVSPSPTPTSTPLPSPTPTLAPTPLPSPTPVPTPTAAPVYPTTLQLSEIMSCPNTGEHEWLEIYNPDDTSYTLTNWKVQDAIGNTRLVSTSIGAHSYSLLTLTSDIFNNTGDSLFLVRPDGQTLFSIVLPACDKGTSFVYANGDWQETTTITPAAANIFTPVGEGGTTDTTTTDQNSTTAATPTPTSTLTNATVLATTDTTTAANSLTSATNLQTTSQKSGQVLGATTDSTDAPSSTNSANLAISSLTADALRSATLSAAASTTSTAIDPSIPQSSPKDPPTTAAPLPTATHSPLAGILFGLGLLCTIGGAYGLYRWYLQRQNTNNKDEASEFDPEAIAGF